MPVDFLRCDTAAIRAMQDHLPPGTAGKAEERQIAAHCARAEPTLELPQPASLYTHPSTVRSASKQRSFSARVPRLMRNMLGNGGSARTMTPNASIAS